MFLFRSLPLDFWPQRVASYHRHAIQLHIVFSIVYFHSHFFKISQAFSLLSITKRYNVMIKKKKPTQPRNKEAGKSNFRLKVRPEIEPYRIWSSLINLVVEVSSWIVDLPIIQYSTSNIELHGRNWKIPKLIEILKFQEFQTRLFAVVLNRFQLHFHSLTSNH